MEIEKGNKIALFVFNIINDIKPEQDPVQQSSLLQRNRMEYFKQSIR